MPGPNVVQDSASPASGTPSKNDIATGLVKRYAHTMEFIDNAVLGVGPTTEALARMAILKMMTTKKSMPSEWEKVPEDVGYSAFTATQPERVYMDVDLIATRIEKRQLTLLMPPKHALYGRRIVFVGLGNAILGEELAQMIWTHYTPSHKATIISPLEECDWIDFYLMVEVSESEIEGSYPGFTKTPAWKDWKNRVTSLTRRRAS